MLAGISLEYRNRSWLKHFQNYVLISPVWDQSDEHIK